ncbi:MAG: CHASE2 domain-containing protein, partial [Cyanobacteriota bacterium]
IDNKTIKELGNWPFSRKYFTEAINYIVKSSPVVIGIVISFTENKNDAEDKELYEVLKSFDNLVIIPKYKSLKTGKITLEMPEKSIFPDIKTGHSLFDFSKGNVVVSIQPFKYYSAFALQVIDLYSQSKLNKQRKLNNNLTTLIGASNKKAYSTNKFILIDYKRLKDKFKHVSFSDIVQKKVNKKVFNNKIVLIGITDKYNTTLYSTPFTSLTGKTSASVEIQAQIIDSFLQYRGLSHLPNWILYLVSIIVTCLFLCLIRSKNILIQGVLFIIIISLVALLDIILYNNFAIWAPPAFLFLLILFSFALSVYFASTKLDKHLIESINRINESQGLKLKRISSDLDSKVSTLTNLIDVINNDRETINTIINSVNSGIMVLDISGNILWFNEKTILIFKNNCSLGQNINELIEDINFEEIKKEIDLKKIYSKEFGVGDLEFFVIFNEIKTDTKQYVAVFNNITELNQINRLKSDMVRMVSHELKNPITSINLCAENIYDIDDRNLAIKNSRNIMKNAQFLKEIIDKFLNLSRLENNMIEINLEKIDLDNVIKECLYIQQTVAEEKNINIVYEKQDPLEISCDKNQILVVLNNLVSNAIKYSFDNSEIQIKAEKGAGYITVSVIDNGLGIPENDIDKIFHKFYRSINNKKDNIKGSGLGLSIVEKIIQFHKGCISVNSEYGKGS